MAKRFPIVTVRLEKIVGGGQALGQIDDGRKIFVWGGLPNELVRVQITKRKSSYAEGRVIEVLEPSDQRIAPLDQGSYLSTSPWQIMDFATEQHFKAALIEEAFELHDIVLPHPITMYSDGNRFAYRNKLEFSWYGSAAVVEQADGSDTRDEVQPENLDLAFFIRGSKGKVPVQQMSLAKPEIVTAAVAIRDLLRTKEVTARNLKTLLIRANQAGDVVWQLYIKDEIQNLISSEEAAKLPAIGGEVIYSDPRSPASKITKRLAAFGTTVLSDTILATDFRYATEGFFQINLPVYEVALRDMKGWIEEHNTSKVVDLYSGVGTIGLTIGGDATTLVEIDEHAVREMKENIARLGKTSNAVLAPSEKALDYITEDSLIIVDPPRAGLHDAVAERILEVLPPRIIYLSCNPVTQARDVAILAEKYGIRAHQGYNFFPCTPHIEHLVVLDLKP